MSQLLGNPADLTLHQALLALYGGRTRQDLNLLTSLICRLALVECALEFLVQCRLHKVYPKFILNSFKFSHQGNHLTRLTGRLHACILHATIRDSRQQIAETQELLNHVWLRLYRAIKDNNQWEMVVTQKDSLCFVSIQLASFRLRKKFTSFFTTPPDCSYSLRPPVRLPLLVSPGSTPNGSRSSATVWAVNHSDLSTSSQLTVAQLVSAPSAVEFVHPSSDLSLASGTFWSANSSIQSTDPDFVSHLDFSQISDQSSELSQCDHRSGLLDQAFIQSDLFVIVSVGT